MEKELLKEIKAAKLGNESSIEEILTRLEPLVNKMSLSFYIYGCDKEDIKQLAKISIIKAIKTFDEKIGDDFLSYAKACVKNEIYKEIEKATRVYYKEKESKAIALAIDVKEIKDQNVNIQEDYIKKEEMKKLTLAISTLEDDERSLLNKIYIEGEKLAKYSKDINLEYYKARYMKDRVLRKLKSLLED